MKKKSKEDSGDETIIAYIHGRIDKEIEIFAASIGLQQEYLRARLSPLIFPMGKGLESNLSNLRSAASQRDSAMESVEGSSTTHRHRSQRRASSSTASRKAAKSKVAKKLSSIAKWWAQFTPEERKKIAAQRKRKWSPEAKAKWSRKAKAA